MRYIEEEGKTVEEALEKALERGGVDRSEARFEVLSEGVGGKPARIRLYLEAEDLDLIEGTIKEFLEKLGTRGEVEIEPQKKRYYVNIRTRGYDSALIGRGGKTLEALDYLLNLMLKRKKTDINISLDVSHYRLRKREFLINKAKAIAQRVKETGREMRMDPLSPEERRLVRDALKRDKEIRTYTVDRGGELILVIAPSKSLKKG
jgi:spoIIIJ-associated protein